MNDGRKKGQGTPTPKKEEREVTQYLTAVGQCYRSDSSVIDTTIQLLHTSVSRTQAAFRWAGVGECKQQLGQPFHDPVFWRHNSSSKQCAAHLGLDQLGVL